jgi:hypothetical protein
MIGLRTQRGICVCFRGDAQKSPRELNADEKVRLTIGSDAFLAWEGKGEAPLFRHRRK